ncbi:MAG: glycosyltransferase [Ferruginibacter sp.]
MKILHITNSLTGGAGIAALRLHEAMLNEGIESKILTGNSGNLISQNITQFRQQNKSILNSRLQNFLVRFKVGVMNSQKNYISTKDLKGAYELFTSPLTDFNLRACKEVEWADIIHLHWISDYLDFNTFFLNLNKPVVWTLHDINPFAGGFHLRKDIADNKSFSLVEKQFMEIKRKAVANVKSLTVVSPSLWLLKESQRSLMFSGRPHYQIYNTLPLDKFYILDKIVARKMLGINEEDNIILLVNNSFTFNKGGDLLEEMLKDQSLKCISFHTVGHLNTVAANLHAHGKIDNISIQNLLYAVCDAVLIMSRDENFPNVMLEAMACGRPVLSFNIGGMSEIVNDHCNGLKASTVDYTGLKQLLLDFVEIKNEFNDNEIRNIALNNFSYPTISKKYDELYQRLLMPNALSQNIHSNPVLQPGPLY